jgi:hypothetical protein
MSIIYCVFDRLPKGLRHWRALRLSQRAAPAARFLKLLGAASDLFNTDQLPIVANPRIFLSRRFRSRAFHVTRGAHGPTHEMGDKRVKDAATNFLNYFGSSLRRQQ